MGIQDLWVRRDGQPSRRHGRGMRYRVRVEGQTAAARTMAEARIIEREMLRESPRAMAGQVVDVRTLMEWWLPTRRGVSAGTWGDYQRRAGIITSRWGDVPCDLVRAGDVAEWLDRLRCADGSVMAASSRRKVLADMRAALQQAVAAQTIPTNPCDGIRVGRSERRDPRFLTPVQVRRVAEALPDDGERARFSLLVTTGVRAGEARAMDVGDVDEARRRVRVRRSKNGAARDVPLAPGVLALLDLSRSADAPLLPGPRGGRFDAHNWGPRVLQPALAAAGVGHLRVHDLRHTAASLAIASGADVKAVQQMLGHKSATMTLDLYGHLLDQTLDEVAVRLQRLLDG